jgi:hypothetical protein
MNLNIGQALEGAFSNLGIEGACGAPQSSGAGTPGQQGGGLGELLEAMLAEQNGAQGADPLAMLAQLTQGGQV